MGKHQRNHRLKKLILTDKEELKTKISMGAFKHVTKKEERDVLISGMSGYSKLSANNMLPLSYIQALSNERIIKENNKILKKWRP